MASGWLMVGWCVLQVADVVGDLGGEATQMMDRICEDNVLFWHCVAGFEDSR